MHLFHFQPALGRVLLRLREDHVTTLTSAEACHHLNRRILAARAMLLISAWWWWEAGGPGRFIAPGLALLLVLGATWHTKLLRRRLEDPAHAPLPVTDLFPGGARDFLLPIAGWFAGMVACTVLAQSLPAAWRAWIALASTLLAGWAWWSFEIALHRECEAR